MKTLHIKILITGMMSFFSNLLFSQELTISEELDKIGYFDLIHHEEKKQVIKAIIDYEFQDDKNHYKGGGWLIIPNNYMLLRFHNHLADDNSSSSTDFRAFEVWVSRHFFGKFVDHLKAGTLKSAKVVFKKNGLRLEWKDEVFNENTKGKIEHRITVNDKEYVVFSGQVSEDNIDEVMIHYENAFKDILNDAIYRQDSKKRIVLLTQPSKILFVLLDPDKINRFKKIISKTNNKLEE
ncbi:hypothetical protein [Flavobacterium piscis]|uniref:Uncharacterized protein n=1 Tax=Flavobacterium piscis TaxID=1114874 RepID=A0ABU1YB98_9FLAO|nr:hypothetical protein [Flavobacterium piscis]MDR7211423.1 hypothetical protein [Flavobacterium piscis]